MTDLERTKEFFASLGVEYTVEDPTTFNWLPPGLKDAKVALNIQQYGYCGFYSEWYFDADGKFLGHGEWE